jgi:serine/threonine protein phosphatase PrpC
MSLYRLEAASITDIGRVRATNQDSVAVDAESGIALVADGMGGHRSGELASRMAKEIMLPRLRSRLAKYKAGRGRTPVEYAGRIAGEVNRAILDAARKDPAAEGMGTTLALALFHGERVTLAHVGDSRIYRLRDGRLELLTRDDSLLRDQVELGLIDAKNAGDSHNRHLVTQALGTAETVAAHVRELESRCDDVYLLCSDGLNDMVGDADIELVLDTLKTNLPLAAAHLVQLAIDCGGYDNVSAVLVRLCPAPQGGPVRRWVRRLFGR